jgi:hypothetical protein
MPHNAEDGAQEKDYKHSPPPNGEGEEYKSVTNSGYLHCSKDQKQ